MNMNLTANHNRNTRSGLSYVYASYVFRNNSGYIAVIDPTTDQIIKRIPTGRNPIAMCLSPSGDKLYVIDAFEEKVFVYSTDTFSPIGEIPVGSKPVAIFVEPSGKRGYVANFREPSVTVFDAVNLKLIGNLNLKNFGMPFAFASNEKSPYVYIACKGITPVEDFTMMIIINNDSYILFSIKGPVFDQTHNPLTVHPNGHPLVELANIGLLTTVVTGGEISNTTSLLDNTVSGVYLKNKLLFCTMREERDFLKVFKNLDMDENGNITYDEFKEIPSYKGQDKIRTSLNEKYIGVTIPAYDLLAGLQIYDVDRGTSQFVTLTSIGDLAFFSDTKAYVGGFNKVTPFDLATAKPLPPIVIGTVYFSVKNVICGYSNQSL
ncbi:hypothetical protein [Paenibacillus silagei]|uniref:EF-hand domain-containing protein n=1 Tax=Paenibacillus silagei TaxID=1670801 RepID=A0ABS4NNE3_9BACL|nr:hypothetical protein [Paenibacillus silagei]MBP2111587.1 hypothetical protein [Paenibacillus silagei]